MISLKFLIDSMCANFTVESICDLIKGQLTRGSCTISDIALEIIQKDPTLDILSAVTLARAAVEALVERGTVALQGDTVYPGGRFSG